jgi:predicted nucleic acid-binding protein
MTPAVQYVLDASVAVKVFLPEPLSAEATALVGLMGNPATVFHVPDLFFVECANIFWKQAQWGNAKPAQVEADLATLSSWRLTRTPTFDLATEALRTAITEGITAYDACYVMLASRQAVPLVTADQKLAQKLVGKSPVVVWLGAWTPPTAPPAATTP